MNRGLQIIATFAGHIFNCRHWQVKPEVLKQRLKYSTIHWILLLWKTNTMELICLSQDMARQATGFDGEPVRSDLNSYN